MRWPRLVPGTVCRCGVRVVLAAGRDENGAPLPGTDKRLYCRWEQTERQVQGDVGSGVSRGRSANGEARQGTELAAVALFDGDIAPELDLLEGRVVTDAGRTWHITRALRARDPDGRVNYTRLELI